MSRYVGVLLTLVMIFPWLFSWFAPFFYLGFLWVLATRTNSIVNTGNFSIAFGFSVFLLMGILLIAINAYLFRNVTPWTYWIVGYATWFIIIVLVRSLNDPANTIHSALVITGLVSGVGNLAYIALFFAGLAIEPISIAGYQAYFGLDERGFFAYSTSHLPHLAFLVPYFVYRFAKSESSIPWYEKWIVVAMIIAGILSLRTAVWMIYLACAGYYIYETKNYKILVAGAVIFVGVILGLMFYLDIDWDIWQGIYDLKLADKVGGEDIRYNQLVFWMGSFMDSPLIGHGLTSAEVVLFDIATGDLIEYIPGAIVSNYGYEILYAKLLSDIGMLFFPYIIIFCWLSFFAKTLSAYSWQVSALRIASLSMIIQSATNSYLQTSGWLFTLMLPMMFVASRSATEGPSLSNIRYA